MIDALRKSSLELQLGILAVLVALFYGTTLINGFVHDDVWTIAQNPRYIQGWSSVTALFTGCLDEQLITSCKEQGFYWRPLVMLSHLITYQISPAPWVFHGVNLIYFFLSGAVVLAFFKILVRDTAFALLGAALFVTHPVNSEVANWVGTVAEPLTVICSLSGFLWYVQWRKKRQTNLLVVSAIWYFASFLAKESALFLLFLPAVYEWLIVGLRSDAASVRAYRHAIGVLGLAATIYLMMRIFVIGRVVYAYQGFYAMSLGQQIRTAIAYYWSYVLLFIFPSSRTIFHRFVPVTVGDPKFLVAALWLPINAVLAFFCYTKKFKLISFGLFLIFLSLLPVLLFVNKLGEYPFAERYAYIGSIGFVLIVVDGVRNMLHRTKGPLVRWVAVVVATVYGAVSFWMAIERNKDWRDNEHSYASVIRVDPQFAKAYEKLGDIYFETKRIDQAKLMYGKARGLDPEASKSAVMAAFLSNQYISEEFRFYYPNDWVIQNGDNGMFRIMNNQGFQAEFSIHDVKPDLLPESMVALASGRGTLINSGLAAVPGIEKAFVKIWKENGNDILEFFLFQANRMLVVRAAPFTSPAMKQLETILLTLDF